MGNYKYDNPDDAYKEAQRYIKKAKGGFLRQEAIILDGSLGIQGVHPYVGMK